MGILLIFFMFYCLLIMKYLIIKKYFGINFIIYIINTTIQFYDENDEVCKLDLIITGPVGVSEQNPNETMACF